MKFRKRPVVIEAHQFNGHNRYEIIMALDLNEAQARSLVAVNPLGSTLFITTLEGEMKASAGDWIIKGVNGELYPCKPDIFEKTYEIAL